MRCIMESLIRQINEVVNTTEDRIFIAISGHGASGKTSFARRLCDSLDADYNFLNTDTYIRMRNILLMVSSPISKLQHVCRSVMN